MVFLERYAVNEPYAYVTITATSPPMYKVSEVRLTRGEEELLEEFARRIRILEWMRKSGMRAKIYIVYILTYLRENKSYEN